MLYRLGSIVIEITIENLTELLETKRKEYKEEEESFKSLTTINNGNLCENTTLRTNKEEDLLEKFIQRR